jgi:hypothetical protein
MQYGVYNDQDIRDVTAYVQALHQYLDWLESEYEILIKELEKWTS